MHILAEAAGGRFRRLLLIYVSLVGRAGFEPATEGVSAGPMAEVLRRRSDGVWWFWISGSAEVVAVLLCCVRHEATVIERGESPLRWAVVAA